MHRLLAATVGALAALIFVLSARAAPRGGADTDSVRALTKGEAAEMWAGFSRAGIAGDYCMEFSIAHRPRRGEETRAFGEIFGSKTPGGFDVTRVRIFTDSPSGAERGLLADFILENDPDSPRVCKVEGGKAREIPRADWAKPFAEGFIYSPFDLLMPYKFWKPKYDGPGRVGQAVHFFRLDPPGGEGSGGAVRLALSREFSSPVQAQVLGPGSRPAKTLKLASVKKIGARWIMREAELRDESTRDKDILRFESANFSEKIPASAFDASSPDPRPRKPAMEKI